MAKRAVLETVMRRRQIYEDRLTGMSVEDIARKYRVDRGTVIRAMNASVENIDATKWLERQTDVAMDRLDILLKTYWPYAIGSMPNAEPSVEHGKFILEVMKRQAALLGLDAPKRIDIRARIATWAQKEGLDPDDVMEVVQGLFPLPGENA